MAERGQWNISTLKGREGLICVEAGGVLCILLGAITLWRYVGFLSPFRPGTKILRALFPSVVSVIVPKPSGVTDASNSNYSPV